MIVIAYGYLLLINMIICFFFLLSLVFSLILASIEKMYQTFDRYTMFEHISPIRS